MSKTDNAITAIYGRYGWLLGPSDLVAAMEANADASGTSDTRSVTLLFRRDALLYDIANIAYVEGDTYLPEAVKGMHDHARHQVQDIAEDGNVDRVTRMLDLVHAWCVETLYPYTREQVEDGTELDDAFAEEAVYRITMQVPATFSRTTALLLERLIHELMVARVLMDWLAITKPSAAEMWSAKGTELNDKIKSIINTRMGVTTRPLRPF